MTASRSSPEEGRSAPCAGLQHYLYGVVEGLPRRWRPPPGIGASVVHAQPVRELALVLSPLDALPPVTRRAAQVHDEVLRTTMEAAAVMPFGVGTVMPPDAVDPWLLAHLSLMRAALADVRGCVEMTVRLLALPRATAGDQAERRLLDPIADRLVERAGIPCWRYRPVGHGAASLAFLVPRDGVTAFLGRIAPIASHAADVAVVPTGPGPAYDFVPALGPAAAPRDPARAREAGSRPLITLAG